MDCVPEPRSGLQEGCLSGRRAAFVDRCPACASAGRARKWLERLRPYVSRLRLPVDGKKPAMVGLAEPAAVWTRGFEWFPN